MSTRKVAPLKPSDSGISSASSRANHDDDDWEVTDEKSYNPLTATQHKNVVRHAQHMTPSERKKFREDECKRLAALKDAEDSKPKPADD